MKCFECNNITEIKKHKAYKYEGVNLDNIYLLNAEVYFCPNCKEEELILQNAALIHNAIGVALTTQPTILSGKEIRYLRRAAGFSLSEWAKRLGVADATYSKWENNHRAVSEYADRLARANFLLAMAERAENSLVSSIVALIGVVLAKDINGKRNFAIAIVADDPLAKPQYLPLDSPILQETVSSYFVLKFDPEETGITTVNLHDFELSQSDPSLIDGINIEEERYARQELALAA